jgi:hypothetical protein
MDSLDINNYGNKEIYFYCICSKYYSDKKLFYNKLNEIEFYDTILFDCLQYEHIFDYFLNKYKDKIDINLQYGDYEYTILHLLINEKQYDLFKEVFNLFKDRMTDKLYNYCIKQIRELNI